MKNLMLPSNRLENRRLLVIDDNPAIHEDFRKILVPPALSANARGFEDDEAAIFGSTPAAVAVPAVVYEVDSAYQGQEGLALVRRAMEEDRPYAMAFVDVRMPPGWDGIETIARIWKEYPDLQVVICTAYSDYGWDEMVNKLGRSDRLLILKKPFDTIEVLQQASALTEKWQLLQDSRSNLDNLDQLVRLRTQELEESRAAAMSMMEEAVRNREGERQACEDLKREAVERAKLEEQFREKASLLDMARDAILVSDLDHRVTYWNKSAERLYGWTAWEVTGRSVTNLNPKDTTRFEEACDQVMQTGEWIGELNQMAKDGSELVVEGHWTLVRAEDGEPKSILAINTNVTEQKKLEQQFLRSQRMESIGALAGGIAHDLNNVLTPITMAVDYLRLKVTDPKCQDVLVTISSCARRGADMVGQVLLFARGMEGRRIEVQPKVLIHDLETICLETFPKNIQVQTAISPGLWAIEGDPTQLHQVLLNLCVNARDAMPQGGRISIRAKNVNLDAQCAAANMDAMPGPHVAIEVEDTGSGIPKEAIEKIFDPFFSTKEPGKGTGLGLSTALSIVKNHGGFMRADSEQGRGTRFYVYLPARTEATAESTEGRVVDVPRGNGELVLVVDDEAFVRQITRQTLEAFGYRVLLASEGTEAVALYAKHEDAIAMVLMDMMMPFMDGAATTMVLMRMNPSVRVVATSGDTTDESIGKADRAGAKHFIPKPYSANTLLTGLSRVLELRA